MNKLPKVFALFSIMLLTACSSKDNSTVEVISSTIPAQVTDYPFYSQPTVVMRTNASEVQILTRLARSMEELEALIREAELNADPDARIRFDYYQLRADIQSITQGIQAHIQIPIYTPRTLDPIVGNYGR